MRTRRSFGSWPMRIAVISAALGWSLKAGLSADAKTPADPKSPVGEAADFARDIRPIFQAHCVKCHGPDKQEGGLRLDHRATALRGGDSGPLLKAGNSGESEIYSRVSATDESLRMPPVRREKQTALEGANRAHQTLDRAGGEMAG